MHFKVRGCRVLLHNACLGSLVETRSFIFVIIMTTSSLSPIKKHDLCTFKGIAHTTFASAFVYYSILLISFLKCTFCTFCKLANMIFSNTNLIWLMLQIWITTLCIDFPDISNKYLLLKCSNIFFNNIIYGIKYFRNTTAIYVFISFYMTNIT